MLTTTLITLTIILERLLASGTLTTALATIFKKALSTLGLYQIFYYLKLIILGKDFFLCPKCGLISRNPAKKRIDYISVVAD